MSNIKLFQDKKIRSKWNEQEEQWYFSVVDEVGALTDSTNPTDYLKKMRKRDEALALYLGTNCPLVEMLTETGKKRKTLAANVKGLFRIIQFAGRRGPISRSVSTPKNYLPKNNSLMLEE